MLLGATIATPPWFVKPMLSGFAAFSKSFLHRTDTLDLPFTGTPLHTSQIITSPEVLNLITKSSSKFSSMDFILTSLLKSCASVFSEITSNLANLSISEGKFPSNLKLAQVPPPLKRSLVLTKTPCNYGTISNLNIISKLRFNASIWNEFDSTPHPPATDHFQSAYLRYYSTEAAFFLALDNIYHSFDKGSSTMLISLDLSTALHTIYHSILLNRLQTIFGITGLASLGSILSCWARSIRSYWRFQFSRQSKLHWFSTGIRSGSHTLYALHITHSTHCWFFLVSHSSSMLIILSCMSLYPDNYAVPVAQLQIYLDALHIWFCDNGLALNQDKSEAVILGTTQRTSTPLSSSPGPWSKFPTGPRFTASPLAAGFPLTNTSRTLSPDSTISVHSTTYHHLYADDTQIFIIIKNLYHRNNLTLRYNFRHLILDDRQTSISQPI